MLLAGSFRALRGQPHGAGTGRRQAQRSRRPRLLLRGKLAPSTLRAAAEAASYDDVMFSKTSESHLVTNVT